MISCSLPASIAHKNKKRTIVQAANSYSGGMIPKALVKRIGGGTVQFHGVISATVRPNRCKARKLQFRKRSTAIRTATGSFSLEAHYAKF
jgi:hypothetical protein